MSLLSHNLQAFTAIVKQGTVHGAAKELHLTQTGVTQRIRALESQLATTLFIRSRKGMKLTSEGQALFRYCQAASELEGDTLAQIIGAGKQKEVRVEITGPTSIMRSRIIPQCAPVLTQFPRLAVSFLITDLENRDQLLRLGESQLAILAPEQVAREMDSKLLNPEQYVLVGPPQWKRRSTEDILKNERIIDFDPSDTMTHAYLKKFKLLRYAQTERHFVNNTESLVDLFRTGVGYGVLTVEFSKSHLMNGAICLLNDGEVMENRLALAWYPRPRMPEYLASFIRAVS